MKERTWIPGRTLDERLLIEKVEIVNEGYEKVAIPQGIIEVVPMKLSQGKIALLYCVQILQGRNLFVKDSSFFV